MHIPALIKILCLFSLIVVLYRMKVPLWGALLGVSLLSGLWFGTPAAKTLVMMARSSVEEETLFLCAVVALIMGFSTMMEKTGLLKRLVTAFSDLLGSSMYSGAALPALIGLLPMPGGAIFSAPMVDEACGSEGCQTPEQKSAVNYWFRHVWEYWWPLYPGVILASQLFHVSAGKMMLLHLPLTLCAVGGGYVFILRRSFPPEWRAVENNVGRAALLRAAISESSSIILVIGCIFIFGPVIAKIGRSGEISERFWPVVIGFILGIIWLAVSTKSGFVKTFKYLFSKGQWNMVLLAVGVMVFRDILTGVNAFSGARADLQMYHVPPIVVIAALPLLAGLVMGLAIGFVGASFPLVISLLPESIMNSQARLAYLTLAYSFGYIGMMLSPVHFCLIMTKDYFKADLGGIYRWILIPGAIVIIAGISFFLIYHSIFR